MMGYLAKKEVLVDILSEWSQYASVTDRQTDRHRPIASIGLRLGSRGRNEKALRGDANTGRCL